MSTLPRPNIDEAAIHETVRLQEAKAGRRCDVLRSPRVEDASLRHYSYLRENCELAGAAIGEFAALEYSVQRGAPVDRGQEPARSA